MKNTFFWGDSSLFPLLTFLEVLEVPKVPNAVLNQIHYFCSAIENLQELLAAEFKKRDQRPIAKAHGRSGDVAKQDFIHVQRLYDGMVMYTDRYVEMKNL